MSNLHPRELFNIDSPQQLAWLFYEKLKYKVERTTEKGAPSVDNRTLPYFDEYGQILINYRKLRDKLKFVVSTSDTHYNGTFHPAFKLAGTVSGRCTASSS